MQAMTFLAFLALADISGAPLKEVKGETENEDELKDELAPPPRTHRQNIDLRYTIEVHLPPTKEIEVYNAIFKSLRQNLLDD